MLRSLLLLSLALLSTSAPGLAAQAAKSPVPAIRKLDSGSKLAVVQTADGTPVHGCLVVPAGPNYETEALFGAARLLAGTLQQAAERDMGSWLSDNAATLKWSADGQWLKAEFSCRAGDTRDFVGRICEQLNSAAESQAHFDTAQAALVKQLEMERDDPSMSADREGLRLLYGHTSPFAPQATPSRIGAFERKDVHAFAEAHIGANASVLSLAGPLKVGEVSTQVSPSLKSLGQVQRAQLSLPKLFTPFPTRIYLVDDPDAEATQLRLYSVSGTRRLDSDHLLELWSELVGDPESGRLNNRLTNIMRMPYGGSAGHQLGWEGQGPFVARAASEHDKVSLTLNTMVAVLQNAIATKAGDLEWNNLIQRWNEEEKQREQDGAELADRAAHLAYFDYPPSYFQLRQALFNATNARDARITGSEYFMQRRLIIVAVGPAQVISKQLETYAKVSEHVPDSTPQVADDAKADVEALLAFMGGRQRWADLERYELKTVHDMGTDHNLSEQPIHQWRYLNSPRMRLESAPYGSPNITVIDGTPGWQSGLFGLQQLNSLSYRKQQIIARDSVFSILNGLALNLVGARINPEYENRLEFFDEHGLIAWMILGEDKRPKFMGYADPHRAIRIEFDQWDETDGYVYASRFTENNHTQGSEPVAWTVITEKFTPNGEFSEELFMKRKL